MLTSCRPLSGTWKTQAQSLEGTHMFGSSATWTPYSSAFFKWRTIANLAKEIKSALNLAIWSILGPMPVATYWR